MKLLIRRDQRSSIFGKPIFTLDFRAETTAEEAANVKKYRLGTSLLFSDSEKNVTVYVSDLFKGKCLECSDIVEMMLLEEKVKELGRFFNRMLILAAGFGGEEVVDLAA